MINFLNSILQVVEKLNVDVESAVDATGNIQMSSK